MEMKKKKLPAKMSDFYYITDNKVSDNRCYISKMVYVDLVLQFS